MTRPNIINKIVGPSSFLFGIKYMYSHLFLRGGNQDVCYSDDGFFEIMAENMNIENKPRRASAKELQNIFGKKAKLTKDQRLVKSLINEAKLSKTISNESFDNLKDLYEFRRKYKNYLRIKRLIPLTLIAPFTNTELSKMAYAAALGSKSVSLTLPGLIGYSLPAFFFFHMLSFYVPDKFKTVCQICKYTFGAPVWIASSFTDELLSGAEEKFLGEEVPIDLIGTGGSIPAELGDINKLREVLNDMKDFSTKT